MKKTAIGIVAVLAMSSMAFGTNSVLLNDITIDPGSSGVMTLSVQGPDLTAGFTLALWVNNWVTTILPHPDINAWRGVPVNPAGGTWDIDDIFDARPEGVSGLGILSSSFDAEYKSIETPANLVIINITVPDGTPEGWYTVVDLVPFGPQLNTVNNEDAPMDIGDGIGEVYVTPEPVSALLLGLGGLFLRRRR